MLENMGKSRRSFYYCHNNILYHFHSKYSNVDDRKNMQHQLGSLVMHLVTLHDEVTSIFRSLSLPLGPARPTPQSGLTVLTVELKFRQVQNQCTQGNLSMASGKISSIVTTRLSFDVKFDIVRHILKHAPEKDPAQWPRFVQYIWPLSGHDLLHSISNY